MINHSYNFIGTIPTEIYQLTAFNQLCVALP